MEILLNSAKNIKSVNVDSYVNIELSNKPTSINEYDIRNVVSVTEVFDAEREANNIYRIYGKIEYLSLLNGLKLTYQLFSDFFNPQLTNCKDIFNSFDIYLTKASTGYSTVNGSSIQYVRDFEVVATANELDIFPIGFSNNVYGEQSYAFNFNVDFDVSLYTDYFGFPATELFLFIQYKPTTSEGLSGTTWLTAGSTSINSIIPKTLNIGDTVKSLNNYKIGDLIEYSESEFIQTQLSQQTFYIKTPYNGGKYLIWKYNPFIPFTLSYFSNNLNIVNSGSTSYEETSTIPYYAKLDNNGNYIWRNILPQGYFDPLTNVGVDYPFVNKRRYLFNNVILGIVPDLNNNETYLAFKDVWFSTNTTKISVVPLDNINNIGKPC